MGMAFSKIVTDRGLINEAEMVPSIILPLMRVSADISSCMLSFGKEIQQR